MRVVGRAGDSDAGLLGELRDHPVAVSPAQGRQREGAGELPLIGAHRHAGEGRAVAQQIRDFAERFEPKFLDDRVHGVIAAGLLPMPAHGKQFVGSFRAGVQVCE